MDLGMTREKLDRSGQKLQSWQHDDTGRITEVSVGVDLGPRWYKISEEVSK